MLDTSYLDNSFKASYYHRFRSSYPDTLVHRILSYHNEVSTNELDTLVEVGCGTGIATKLFMNHFKQCIATDPSSRMLECAKNTFPKDSNVTFKIAKGEDLMEDGEITLNSVDMVIGAQSIHWCDFDTLFEQIYGILKPNDTFAFWFYTQPEFIELDGFNEIYYKYG